jgi:hypothetical protein
VALTPNHLLLFKMTIGTLKMFLLKIGILNEQDKIVIKIIFKKIIWRRRVSIPVPLTC